MDCHSKKQFPNSSIGFLETCIKNINDGMELTDGLPIAIPSNILWIESAITIKKLLNEVNICFSILWDFISIFDGVVATEGLLDSESVSDV